MAINFTIDVYIPLYGPNVISDAEYLAIEPQRRNEQTEHRMITMIELMRSYMTELRDDNEARVFHYVMGRMLAGMAYNTIYDDLVARVSGNDPGVAVSAANGDTVDVTDANGTDNVVLSAGPFADLDAVIADINGQIANAVFVEAYNDAGKLAFRNTTGNEGESFTLDYGAGPSLLNKAGIEAQTVFNQIEAVANAARDDALTHYQRAANPTIL